MLSFTSPRRLRHATPQVETLENIVSLSSFAYQANYAAIYQAAGKSHDVAQAAGIEQGNANNGSTVFQFQYVTASS